MGSLFRITVHFWDDFLLPLFFLFVRLLLIFHFELQVPKEEGGPFPVEILRIIPQPEDAKAWDHAELKIKLVIENKDMASLPIRVECLQPEGGLPLDHCDLIAEKLEKKWTKKLEKELKSEEEEKTWQLQSVFKYVEKEYVDLLRLAAKVCVLFIAPYPTSLIRSFFIFLSSALSEGGYRGDRSVRARRR
jgi:hypothetical protein